MDFSSREELFREAVIAFLVPKDKDKIKVKDEYCKACKAARPNADCGSCDHSKIKVIGENKSNATATS